MTGLEWRILLHIRRTRRQFIRSLNLWCNKKNRILNFNQQPIVVKFLDLKQFNRKPICWNSLLIFSYDLKTKWTKFVLLWKCNLKTNNLQTLILTTAYKLINLGWRSNFITFASSRNDSDDIVPDLSVFIATSVVLFHNPKINVVERYILFGV